MAFNRKQFLQTSGMLAAGSLLIPQIAPGMEQVLLINKESAAMMTPITSSEKDYAFFMGSWKIRNRKLKSRFTNSNEWLEFDATEEVIKILNGMGYMGQYHTSFDGKPFEGVGIHLFDPNTKHWNNYWADGSSGIMAAPVVGFFEKNIGTFYGKDMDGNKPVDVRFRWEVTNNDTHTWSQAFSVDAGKSWETNWYMYYSRV